MPKDAAVVVLLDLLDEAFDRKAWHGTNLRGSVRRLDARSAAWRPAPGRHNVWELTVHAAYWKYAVRRQLTGEKRGSFPEKGSNFFPRQGGDEAAWRRDVGLLVEQHRRLREVVSGLRGIGPPAQALGEPLHDRRHRAGDRVPRPLPRGPDPAPEAALSLRTA